MNLQSMTGYGRAEAAARGLRVAVELSSVNRRQLDVQLNLPRTLGTLEPRFLETIRKRVTRGRINGTVIVKTAAGSAGTGIEIDLARARRYAARIRKAAGALRLKDDLSAQWLASLPDVVRFRDDRDDPGKVWPLCRAALEQALRQLVSSRAREGKALHKDLCRRLGLLNVILGRIRERAPGVAREYRRTLRERLARADIPMDPNDERLLREVAMFAERCDIAEETTRLASHLEQAARFLASGKSVGRELDFLAQEMLREINTIGSKANDIALQKQVIAFKSELERIREQAQNVE